ncbi:hypothetical protein J3L18_18115 [Mucilaginibacter gossypii]|uniref:hypothetical protein n=1 Tax=Mucilaginibacter gossypii TaxID=551996 RepID=UPI000DCD69E9|nr:MULTISPECIES: hypothetical protein [Mucilaginibacter]QTE35057.1 hypothetical protein J3L18_18115 [Mucilaginibacter gossypii]RAV59844.1 hypothetical protein DIU36_03970 [Mucilaginibacter rubeus]
MKENIELSKTREFGDIISDTFVIVRQNFKPLFKSYLVICGMFLLTSTLLTILSNFQHTQEGEYSAFSFWGIAKILFEQVNYSALVLTAISYLAVYQQKENQPPTTLEVWAYFKYYFFRVLGTQILLSVALVIAFFFCFFPLVYLAPIFGLVTPIMIIENGSVEFAIRKSFKIIKENWWFTFGVILLMSIIVLAMVMALFIPAMIFYGGSQWLTGTYYNTTYAVVEAIIEHVCQFLWLLPVISITLVYFSLTEHKEANNLVNRIKSFGKNDPATDQFSTEQY